MSKSNPFAAPARIYSRAKKVEATPDSEPAADESVVETAPSASTPDEVVEEETTEVVEEAPVEEVPSGTINEVKAWVGDDKNRAQAALDAERESEEGGRSTLVKYLEDMISGD